MLLVKSLMTSIFKRHSKYICCSYLIKQTALFLSGFLSLLLLLFAHTNIALMYSSQIYSFTKISHLVVMPIDIKYM